MRGLWILLLSTAVWAQSTDDEAAKRHYLSGQAYFNRARYEDALREFDESYKLSHREAIWYNVGLCQEKLDHVDEAVAALEKYLQAEPNSPRRESVNELVERLRGRQREQAAKAAKAAAADRAAATEVGTGSGTGTGTVGANVNVNGNANVNANVNANASVSVAPVRRHRLRPAAIAVAGVAIAALIAGAGSYGVAAREFNELHDVTCVAKKCTPTDWAGPETAANAGYGLLAAAGAAAAADVVLWILQVRY